MRSRRVAAFVAVLHEVVRTELDVVGVVLQHVVGGGDDRCGDRDDRLLGPAAGLDPLILGLQVRSLRTRGRPRALNEVRPKPRRSIAQARRSPFAGALSLRGQSPAHEIA